VTTFTGRARRSAPDASSRGARFRSRLAPRPRRRCLQRHRGRRNCPHVPGGCPAGATFQARVGDRPVSRGRPPVVVRHGRRDVRAVPRDARLPVRRVEGTAAAGWRQASLQGAEEPYDLHVTILPCCRGRGNARRARRRRTSGRHTPLSCPAAEWRARTGTRRPPPGAPGPTRWASTPPFPTSPSRRPLDGRLDRARDDAADAVVGAADERAHRQQQHADGHRQGDAEHGRPQPASGNPDVAARRQVSGSNPSGYEPGFVSGVPAYANAPPGHCSFTPAP
jgi:hypothetical protein